MPLPLRVPLIYWVRGQTHLRLWNKAIALHSVQEINGLNSYRLRIARKGMEKVFIVHYGEVGLKGRNRSFFENRLARNIRQALEDTEYVDVQRIYGRILVRLGPDSDISEIQRRLRTVMGIVHFELCGVADQNMEAIKRAALGWVRGQEFHTLKVETRPGKQAFSAHLPGNQRRGRWVSAQVHRRQGGHAPPGSAVLD